MLGGGGGEAKGFTEVATAYAAHCARHRPGEEIDARAELAAFLDVGDGDTEPVISTDVRIVLVSAGFGREITTTVLWLNGFDGMDVRCVRIIPYDLEGRVLLDVQQVLPLGRTRRRVAERGRNAETDPQDRRRGSGEEPLGRLVRRKRGPGPPERWEDPCRRG